MKAQTALTVTFDHFLPNGQKCTANLVLTVNVVLHELLRGINAAYYKGLIRKELIAQGFRLVHNITGQLGTYYCPQRFSFDLSY